MENVWFDEICKVETSLFTELMS